MRHPILLLAAACVFAAEGQPQTLNIGTSKLPNGVEFVTAEDHSRPVVNIQVWYRVGSTNEQPGRTGFAHLFEHTDIPRLEEPWPGGTLPAGECRSPVDSFRVAGLFLGRAV